MVNKVILVGFVGKDPEVRYTDKGQAVAELRVATSRAWTDRASGQRREETEWHDVEVWGKTAKACGELLAKGGQVYVEGRIKTDRWKDRKTGEDRSRVQIVAQSIRFLGRLERRQHEAVPTEGRRQPSPSQAEDIAA